MDVLTAICSSENRPIVIEPKHGHMFEFAMHMEYACEILKKPIYVKTQNGNIPIVYQENRHGTLRIGPMLSKMKREDVIDLFDRKLFIPIIHDQK